MRAASAMSAPWWARASATPRPRPRLPPVTSATWPSSRKLGIWNSSSRGRTRVVIRSPIVALLPRVGDSVADVRPRARFTSGDPSRPTWTPEGGSVDLDAPRAVHVATRLEDVVAVVAEADRAAARGQWAAVMIAYEAAAAFDPAMASAIRADGRAGPAAGLGRGLRRRDGDPPAVRRTEPPHAAARVPRGRDRPGAVDAVADARALRRRHRPRRRVHRRRRHLPGELHVRAGARGRRPDRGGRPRRLGRRAVRGARGRLRRAARPRRLRRPERVAGAVRRAPRRPARGAADEGHRPARPLARRGSRAARRARRRARRRAPRT